jgi:hypothetical protein
MPTGAARFHSQIGLNVAHFAGLSVQIECPPRVRPRRGQFVVPVREFANCVSEIKLKLNYDSTQINWSRKLLNIGF